MLSTHRSWLAQGRTSSQKEGAQIGSRAERWEVKVTGWSVNALMHLKLHEYKNFYSFTWFLFWVIPYIQLWLHATCWRLPKSGCQAWSMFSNLFIHQLSNISSHISHFSQSYQTWYFYNWPPHHSHPAHVQMFLNVSLGPPRSRCHIGIRDGRALLETPVKKG